MDYKSYTCTTGIDEKQFKQYLQCWNNGPGVIGTPNARSFQYIFNSDKLTLDQAKQKFLTLFKSNPTGYYNINPGFFQTANQFWDTPEAFAGAVSSISLSNALFNFVTITP